jgi:hypothetical protein
MAIVKNNYVKQGRGDRARAKATIRYIQHRAGKTGAKIQRTLWGTDGKMERKEAYRMIDEAEKGSVFYRLVISPDPILEDTRHDLSLREITETTMHALEDHIQKHVSWVASVHADHTDIRHVHIVAVVPRRLQPLEFQALPQVLIKAATRESVSQRRQQDQVLEGKSKEQEREEAGWEL